MMGPRKKGESGVSVLEALMALTILALLLPGLWTVVAQHRKAGTVVATRAEVLEGIRTLSWLLDRELGMGREGRDWVADGDSVALRAFRGMGVIDSVAPDSMRVFVCFSGVRQPVPAKDSILIVGPDGSWASVDLRAQRETASECTGGRTWGTAEEWTLSGPPGRAGLVRVFERGSYHLVDGAFRYRRGEGGRQPLTAEFVEAGRFQPLPSGRNGIGWEIELRNRALPASGGEERGVAGIWKGAGG